MKTPDNPPSESVTRWLDGTLSPAEKTAFQERLRSDPALRTEVESLEKLGGLVRAHALLEKPVPNPDFFNSQIQERIVELQRVDERRKGEAFAETWLGWLRARWAPWALAGTALLAMALMITLDRERPHTHVVNLYVPDPSVKASVNYNSAADATVLTLDGLSALPDDKVISGLRVHHSDNDPEMASTTLYDANDKVLLVMATDAGNRPLLMGLRNDE